MNYVIDTKNLKLVKGDVLYDDLSPNIIYYQLDHTNQSDVALLYTKEVNDSGEKFHLDIGKFQEGKILLDKQPSFVKQYLN